MALSFASIALRIVTGSILLGLVLLLTWHPSQAAHVGFTLFIAFLAGLGLYECCGLLVRKGIIIEKGATVVAGSLIVLVGYFNSLAAVNATLIIGFIFIAALQLLRNKHSLAVFAGVMFGLAYVGWFGAHLTLLRSIPEYGPGLVVMLVLAVFLCDTCAYFVGALIGRHKMAPAISPNKTWEGAIGGLLGAIAGAVALHALHGSGAVSSMPAWSLLQYIVVAVALAVSAQLGDLVESCLKRDAGVKDSGTILPGHGGVLDRCDGFLFAAPVLYYIAVCCTYP